MLLTKGHVARSAVLRRGDRLRALRPPSGVETVPQDCNVSAEAMCHCASAPGSMNTSRQLIAFAGPQWLGAASGDWVACPTRMGGGSQMTPSLRPPPELCFGDAGGGVGGLNGTSGSIGIPVSTGGKPGSTASLEVTVGVAATAVVELTAGRLLAPVPASLGAARDAQPTTATATRHALKAAGTNRPD